MTERTKNKWIAVVIALAVTGVFFGGLSIYMSATGAPEAEQGVPSFGSDLTGTTDTNTAAVNNPSQFNQNTNMPTELEITDVVVGAGAEAKLGDTVEVHYTGTFIDGTKFDSSVDRGQTFSFKLGAGMVIAGWDQGVAGMKVGGKRKLVIPSDLAYGPNDYASIPGGSTLLFDVELVGIK
jgi:FKBP-type peptidyl-prolyl cis-trans isomerase